MQMLRKLDDHTFQMLEVVSNGLYHRVASATVDLEEFPHETLEAIASTYYGPCNGRSALEELAEANDVQCVGYGDEVIRH